METGLEIKIDGKRIGKLQITKKSKFLEISGDLIPGGKYFFKLKEIKKLIEKRMEKDYPGRNIEINEYASNVEFVKNPEKDYSWKNFMRRNID